MGFFSTFFGLAETKSSDPVGVAVPVRSADEIRADVANASTGANSLLITTVFAGARVIAEGLAQVDCILQRTGKNGGREEARDHPLHQLLRSTPNSYQTSFEFREWLGFRLAILGNAFVYVARDTRGRPIELIPLEAGQVEVVTNTFGEIKYRLRVSGQPIFGDDHIWHLRGPSWDGVNGLSLQATAARALGLTYHLETFGENLFRNGARPSGVLSTEQQLTPDQTAQLRGAWNAAQSGIDNAHKTAVLGGGLKFQSIQTSANEAQWIESRRFQIEEIARVMRLDPIMVQQSVDAASYASIEQRFLAHMTHSMGPWHSRFMQSAERVLLSVKEREQGYRIHLDSRSMTRGSAKDRADYLALMCQNGFMSRNEAREFEGLDRFDDPEADKLTPAANLFGPAPTNDLSAK